ncbi:MAG TPA: 50S ribosomal protein L5 [Flavobacteriaceae bacterium]|nr:50S ribosomal protein L5 [Flavobacteriaceae bacterium]
MKSFRKIMNYVPTLKKDYNERVKSALVEKFNYENMMEVPKLTKIVISKGIGEAIADRKLIDQAIDELTLITGQRAVPTISKKDVAAFKLRKGMPIGAKVTLRGERMYEFLDRLITAALPRVRDFQGLSPKGFDGHGNYNMGITEQIIFPEIDIDKVKRITGMDVTFVTDADTDREGKALLTELGLPFKKN